MNRRFAFGILIGLILFLGLNLTSAHLSSDCGLIAVFGRDACADDIARAGWPLQFYERGGFDEHSMNDTSNLMIDVFIGFTFSVVFGWWFARRLKSL